MVEENQELQPPAHDRAWPLYGAAFATGLSLSIAWTALPFVLNAIGGTAAHVGYAPATNSLAYMAALLVTGALLGHLDVKRATRVAMVVAIVAASLMALGVLGALLLPAVHYRIWVWTIIAAGGLGGMAMALHWPFLMSWVSGRYEGVELNRRFGRYNGSWSGGGLVGPLIGAWLVEIGPVWPMLAAVLCLVVSFLLLGLGRNGTGRAQSPAQATDTAEVPNNARMLADYRWMSRIALFCAWASFAIARSQFALLFIELGYSESQFGLYLTTIALCNFMALTAGGRWAFWHFKAGLLIGAQGMILVAMLMIIYGRTVGVFLVSAVVLGVAFGFAYSSHLFYGASTSRKRSGRMAIHEMVISVGITVGAGAGGYLAKNVGLYAPYWFAVSLVALGMMVQILIHTASRATLALHRAGDASNGPGAAD